MTTPPARPAAPDLRRTAHADRRCCSGHHPAVDRCPHPGRRTPHRARRRMAEPGRRPAPRRRQHARRIPARRSDAKGTGPFDRHRSGLDPLDPTGRHRVAGVTGATDVRSGVRRRQGHAGADAPGRRRRTHSAPGPQKHRLTQDMATSRRQPIGPLTGRATSPKNRMRSPGAFAPRHVYQVHRIEVPSCLVSV